MNGQNWGQIKWIEFEKLESDIYMYNAWKFILDLLLCRDSANAQMLRTYKQQK